MDLRVECDYIWGIGSLKELVFEYRVARNPTIK